MTRRFGRFLVVLLILAALQFIFGDARAAGDALREGDEVTFALPGTQRTYCGRVTVLVEWVGLPYAWVQAGSLVARLPVAVLVRGCARPAKMA